MLDDYYSLDEILSEAKRIKGQKVYGEREDENAPPIRPANRPPRQQEQPGQGYNTAYEQPQAPYGNGYEGAQGGRVMPAYAPPQNYIPPQPPPPPVARTEQVPPSPPPVTRVEQVPPSPPPAARTEQAPPAPRRFSIARESEVFGSYGQNPPPKAPAEAPPEVRRTSYSDEWREGYASAVPPVRKQEPYAPPSEPAPEWLHEQQASYPTPPAQPVYRQSGEPAAYRQPPEPQEQPRRQPPQPYNSPRQQAAEPYSAQGARYDEPDRQPYTQPSEPPRAEAPEPEYTPPAPYEEPPLSGGFRLRRPVRRPEAPQENAPPYAPYIEPTEEAALPSYGEIPPERQAPPSIQEPAPSVQDHDTKQFNTLSPLDMETAGELAGAAPLAGGQLTVPQAQPESRVSRWQAYRMLEEDGTLPPAEAQEAAEEAVFDENELNSPEDLPNVLHRLRIRQILAYLRAAVLTLTSVGAIYLILTLIAVTLPIPDAISAQKAPGMYAVSLFALSFISFLVSIMPIGHGLLSLFRLKANTDSMTALASVSTLVYTFAFVARPSMMQHQNAQYYCVAAIVGLWFNAVGKVTMLSRIRHNLSVATSGEVMHAVKIAENGEFARSVATVMDEEEPKVAVASPAGFLQGFMHASYDDEQAQGASRILSPICFGAAVVLSAASYFLYKDILSCLTVFTAVVCVCAPFTSVLVINLPLLRAAKSLTPRGAMLSGSAAAEELSEASAVAINAAELFPTGSITLHGIRTFKGGRIDMSILEAASIMEKVGGTMADIFFQIIEGRKEILENVEDIVYEEGMGISAWVNGKRVLIGNRELMRHHGVELPPREYELKYTQEGRDLMYLATSGELSSMFVISYHASPAVYRRLKRLEHSGVAILVKTTDPNITRDMLSDLYELDYDLVQIMPAALHGTYAELTAENPCDRAAAATMGGAQALIDTVLAAVKVKSSASTAALLQMLFIVLGYGLATLITFFYGISLINPLLLLSYQLVSALVVTLFISARSY